MSVNKNRRSTYNTRFLTKLMHLSCIVRIPFRMTLLYWVFLFKLLHINTWITIPVCQNRINVSTFVIEAKEKVYRSLLIVFRMWIHCKINLEFHVLICFDFFL